MISVTSDPRLTQIIADARAGLTLRGIAEKQGISSERIRQLLTRSGHTITSLRDIHCHYCGALCSGICTQENALGWHACQGCLRRYQRDCRHRDALVRGICSVCHTILRRRPRADGQPQFCAKTKACNAARMRHRYAINPYHRAYYQQYRQRPNVQERQRENSRRWKEKQRRMRMAAEESARVMVA